MYLVTCTLKNLFTIYCLLLVVHCVFCFFLFHSESYLGQNVKNAVVTVPAYFNDSQRQVIYYATHLHVHVQASIL